MQIVNTAELKITVQYRMIDYGADSEYGRNQYLGRYCAEASCGGGRTLIGNGWGHTKDEAFCNMHAKISGKWYERG